MIGVEAGDSLGISVTGETPQESEADRGGSPHAPRKASCWNANQRVLMLFQIPRISESFTTLDNLS